MTQNYNFNSSVEVKRNSLTITCLGKNKNDGSFVNVKKLLPHCEDKFWLIRQEMKILKQLRNENIVALLASETELNHADSEVLILDYCNQGSLHDKLLEPRFKFGLNDQEYLNLLKCLKSGLHYLHQKQICHRDIKPANIRLHKSISGRIVYKLDDFTFAEQLGPTKSFTSIMGTAEYMYPAMYRATVLSDAKFSNGFGAEVDLWSLGITLYQAATGRLPFQSESRQTLCKLYSEKLPGMISGIEKGNKTFEWSSQLPDKCALSEEFKFIVTPLLQLLLETQSDQICTFDKFFNTAQDIVEHRAVNLFQPLMGDLKICYIQLAELSPADLNSKIREKALQLWAIPVTLLYQCGQPLVPQCQTLLTGFDSPSVICTSSDCPGNTIKKHTRISFKSFNLPQPSIKSYENADRFIEDTTAELHFLSLKTGFLHKSLPLYDDFVNVFHANIQDRMRQVQLEMPKMMSQLQTNIAFGQQIIRLQAMMEDDSQSLPSKSFYCSDKFGNDLKELSNNSEEAKKLSTQYDEKILQGFELRKRWKQPALPSEGEFNMDYFFDELKEISRSLQRIKNSSNKDEEVMLLDFQLEGKHAYQLYLSALNSVKNLDQHMTNLSDCLTKWLQSANNVNQKVEKLSNFKTKLEESRLRIDKISHDILEDILQCPSRFSSMISNPALGPRSFHDRENADI